MSGISQTLQNGTQPDFNDMAASHERLAVQFRHCVNLAPVQNNNAFDAILGELRGLRSSMERIEGRMDSMETRMGNIETRMGNIETGLRELKISDKNNHIRHENNSVHQANPHLDLVPLLSISNGQTIENFPKSISDIDRMGEQQLKDILTLLGLPISTSRSRNAAVPEMRRQLKKATEIYVSPPPRV